MSNAWLYAALVMALLALMLILLSIRHPAMAGGSSGKALVFVAFCILPLLATVFGTAGHMEQAKSTEFCLSCHVMEPYGRSLQVADPSYLAANHVQNRRVDSEQSCYTCHTTYTMFGGVRAKLQGLQHLYVYYLVEVPEELSLYQPYRNRECLSCHGGARSFEEDELHADLRPDLADDSVSCLECHTPVHDVAGLDEQELWQGALP